MHQVLVLVCNYALMPRPVSTTTTVGKARAALGLSAPELARRAGVGASTIQKLESGRYALTSDMAKKLALTLGVSPIWLLSGSPDQVPQSIAPGLSCGSAPVNRSGPILSDGGTDPEMGKAIATAAQFELDVLHEVVRKSLADGRGLRVLTDLTLAVEHVIKQNYPDDLNLESQRKAHWALRNRDCSGGYAPTQPLKSSRNPRQRVGR